VKSFEGRCGGGNGGRVFTVAECIEPQAFRSCATLLRTWQHEVLEVSRRSRCLQN